MNEKQMDKVQQGVTESFDFWLSQHDVSFPQLLEDAIERAFQGWLDSNIDTLCSNDSFSPYETIS